MAPPWHLPPTARPKDAKDWPRQAIYTNIDGFYAKHDVFYAKKDEFWPRQTVPTSLHDDAMHAAPMRLDYAVANPAAQRRMGMNAANWHAAAVQTMTTDTLSDHFPLQVLLCEDGGKGAGYERICQEKIRQRLAAREFSELRLGCAGLGWDKWKLKQVANAQRAANREVAIRMQQAVQARPDVDVAGWQARVQAAGKDLLIDWADPLLWRPWAASIVSNFALK